jgi:hypothetical protein
LQGRDQEHGACAHQELRQREIDHVGPAVLACRFGSATS